ncbi:MULTISPECIES: DoxX family protein [unclassified Arthrobacter]|uniref:DoxX family protein n=1 Tax=unclassified Arthrobacter TaxID=235627 RepID=UPI00159E3E94|nr:MULTISPECIES: DoxX family membrane protein [unclassified Arthrobacter]MCQ9162900.1 DoxX family membrane protein [Arthrobacter sp. STN4]NVM97435.1 DoxX family membrane protein [Arthrobacter sp. SDTb3-6]
MTIVRALARPMLASSFILSGLDSLRNVDRTTRQLDPVLDRVSAALPFDASEKTLARAIAGAQVGAGVLLATGKFARPAALLLTATAAVTTFVEYRSSATDTKEAKAHRRSQLARNIGLLGGALLASVDTAGRPGLAWRAGKLIESGRKGTNRRIKAADRNARALAHDVTGQ